MALTKLPKNAIADDAVNADKIADGTIQNQDVQGSISNDKLENSSFTLNGTEVSLGASQSVITYLEWQAVQVADGSTQVNAESGKGYFLDTNAGVIEVFLPTSPSRGDVVGLVDYAGTFGTNQLIINTGGVNIDSTVGSEFKVTTNNAIVECVYVDAAKGWLVYLNQAAGTTPDSALTGFSSSYDNIEPTFISATGGTVTESGDYKIHTFTGDGCFVVSQIGSNGGPSNVDYLVVAGGGSGGTNQGGAGGAGGFRESHSVLVSGCYTASPLATPTGITVTATTYPVTVGGGAASGNPPNVSGTAGSNSVFSTITSTGGGAGIGLAQTEPGAPYFISTQGGSGGSGGGGSGAYHQITTGGVGNTPPVNPPQGNPGSGNSGPAGASPTNVGAGGGGGAGTAAVDTTLVQGADGGDGVTTSISGTSTSYAGGGGGSSGGPAPAGGAGGIGGGGAGSLASGPAVSGTVNTGGGGGGEANNANPSGAGGKGIVVIRYKFQ